MFVVHTVNQLEEAVRVGAEEILVTGGLANNVHEVYLLKTYKDDDGATAKLSDGQQAFPLMDSVVHRVGSPISGFTSLKMITGEYALLDSQLDSRSPCMILRRTTQH